MIYNGISFIGFEEIWKVISYHDIKRNTYEVSNLGRIRKIKNSKILYGCNPKNEHGNYIRISLKSIEGKQKKYPLHRIVYFEFKDDYNEEFEINHIDHNKSNNSVYNLNLMTRKENAHDAAIYDLYKNCDSHYKAIFSNNEVNKICELLEKGESITRIIDILNLKNKGSVYSNIDKIANGKTWKKISNNYNIDFNKYHYKTYSYDDIYSMCDMIFNKKKSLKEIINFFPNYNSKNLYIMLKSLKKKRIYKKIINKFESSTTKEM